MSKKAEKIEVFYGISKISDAEDLRNMSDYYSDRYSDDRLKFLEYTRDSCLVNIINSCKKSATDGSYRLTVRKNSLDYYTEDDRIYTIRFILEELGFELFLDNYNSDNIIISWEGK